METTQRTSDRPTAQVRADFSGTARFQVLSRVGQGGGGVVYEALDRERKMRVALKTLRVPSGETLLRLKREFRSVQDIRHPNLVQLGELFEEDGQWFFTMEFVQGLDFTKYVRGTATAFRDEPASNLPFNEKRLRAALIQLVSGVRALHQARKVHRDLKPSNVLVTLEGRVVILDFGVMSDLENIRERASEEQTLIGTVSYMAPEQAKGGQPTSPAADWYALGTMIFSALTGRLPFEGTIDQILETKTSKAAPLPQTLVEALPADLCELCETLLRTDPTLRPSGNEILTKLRAPAEADPARAPTYLFVGRKRELSILDEASKGIGQRCATVVLRGPSGVGKTHLLRHFLDQLRASHPRALILSGRCYERESVPYKGIDAIVDDLLLHLQDLPASDLAALAPSHAHLVAQAFPVLARLPIFTMSSAEANTELVPQEMRSRLFAAFRELFLGVARRWPLVIAVDDFQWANSDSQALIAALSAPPEAPPLLLIMTERAWTETGNRPRIEMPSDVLTVDIEHLPEDDASELATRLLGVADERTVRTIVAEAQGHPLFIDELTRTESTGGRMRLEEALWARISKLEPPARRIVELLSIAGPPITQTVAALATSMNLGELFDGLNVLRSEKLVRSEGTRREDAIAPYHDRIRESVVAHLDLSTRIDWHAKLAVALENAQVRDLEMLAAHWRGAEQFERAADYALLAAEESARALAFDRAARLYREALSLKSMDGAQTTKVKRALAEALINGGRGAEAAAVLLDAATTCDPLVAIDLRRIAAEQYLVSGHFDEGLQTLRTVMEQVNLRYPMTPFRTVTMLLFYRILLGLRGFHFRARQSSDVDPRAGLRVDVSWSAAQGLIMTDAMRGTCMRSINSLHALRLGDKSRVLRALAFEALSGGAVNHKLSERLLARTKELHTEVPTPFADAMVRACEGGMAYFWGEWTRAVPLLFEAEKIFRDRCRGTQFELNSVRMMLYRCLASRGMLKELSTFVVPVRRDAERRHDRYAMHIIRTMPLTTIGLANDEPDVVERYAQQAEADLPSGRLLVQHYLHLCSRGLLELYRGEPIAVHERYERNARALKQSMLLRVAIVRISVTDQRARAAIGAAALCPDRKRALLEEAAKQIESLGREEDRWARALGQVASASHLAARNEREAAIVRMRAAVLALDECGMDLHRAAAQLRLGEWIGGAEGASLVTDADARMAELGVVNPARFANAHVPPVRF